MFNPVWECGVFLNIPVQFLRRLILKISILYIHLQTPFRMESDPKEMNLFHKKSGLPFMHWLMLSQISSPLHIQSRIILCDHSQMINWLFSTQHFLSSSCANYSQFMMTHKKGTEICTVVLNPTIYGFTSVMMIKNGKTTQIILSDLTGIHFGIQNLILLHKERSRVCIRIIIMI